MQRELARRHRRCHRGWRKILRHGPEWDQRRTGELIATMAGDPMEARRWKLCSLTLRLGTGIVGLEVGGLPPFLVLGQGLGVLAASGKKTIYCNACRRLKRAIQ